MSKLGAKGSRGRRAKGRACDGLHSRSFLPSVPLPLGPPARRLLCPSAPLPLCPSAPLPLAFRLWGVAVLALFLMMPPFSLASDSGQGRWAILISGISGDPELQEEFLKWIRDLHAALAGPMQFDRGHVFVLFDDPSKDPGLISYKSTRENLEKVCREIASRVGKDDLVFVFIAGHGNFDAKTYKLNLPGPDPTAEELASILYSIPAARFVVANMTTCSGASVPALSRKGKIVVSATKSGMEKNQTQMGRFFVEAFKNGNADSDKNGRVSVLEAFNYAAHKVEEYYSTQGLLKTEHPVLDDDGDGKGQSDPGPENGEGFLARTTYLDTGVPAWARGKGTPEEEALLAEMQTVESQIEALKYARSEMPEAEYEKKLEGLLVRLATINAKLRKNK